MAETARDTCISNRELKDHAAGGGGTGTNLNRISNRELKAARPATEEAAAVNTEISISNRELKGTHWADYDRHVALYWHLK